MKKYFIQYKPFLIFLAKFIVTYALLTGVYQYYLTPFQGENTEPDSFTVLVSDQSEWLVKQLGYEAKTYIKINDEFTRFYVDKKYVARVVEGCNALSVMILFVAFVVAFKGKVWHTILFSIAGVGFIHLLNIIRIALLVIGLRYYPEYRELMHDIVFPLFIYGVVFLLWIFWVNKFSVHAKKK
uniref:exosortase family protein XrtF n=1 Tax=Flavobacterium sp. TaxID=239 RepID=UPI00404A1CE2